LTVDFLSGSVRATAENVCMEIVEVFDEARPVENLAALDRVKARYPKARVAFWERTILRFFDRRNGACAREMVTERGRWCVGDPHRAAFMPRGPLYKGVDYWLTVEGRNREFLPFDNRVLDMLVRAERKTRSVRQAENEAVRAGFETARRERVREIVRARWPGIRAVSYDEMTAHYTVSERNARIEALHRRLLRRSPLARAPVG